jgi:hypothetical protein
VGTDLHPSKKREGGWRRMKGKAMWPLQAMLRFIFSLRKLEKSLKVLKEGS